MPGFRFVLNEPRHFFTAPVFDDLVGDVLTGSSDLDWFYYQLGQDTATDRKANELVN